MTRPSEGRNEALDGLRGYAAAAVVIYHSILGCSSLLLPDVLYRSALAQHTAYGWAVKITLSVLNGDGAVAIFFAISGVVLFRALRSMDRGSAAGLAWRFGLRRLLRLWPPMAICLVVQTVVQDVAGRLAPGLTERHPLSALYDNLLLTHTVVNGATWTLAVELAAAPWLVAFYLAVRRWGLVRAAIGTGAAVWAVRHVGWLQEPAGTAAGLPIILAGACLEAGLGAWAERWGVWRAGLPAGLLVIFGGAMLVPFSPGWLHLLVLLGGATLAVGGVARGGTGPAHRFLASGLSRFLGRISYSLYLWNVVIILLLLGLPGAALKAAHPLEVGLAVGVLGVLLTIPVAVLAERWTEQPFIRLGRALTRAGRSGVGAVARTEVTRA